MKPSISGIPEINVLLMDSRMLMKLSVVSSPPKTGSFQVSSQMCNAIGVLHGGALMSFCVPWRWI